MKNLHDWVGEFFVRGKLPQDDVLNGEIFLCIVVHNVVLRKLRESSSNEYIPSEAPQPFGRVRKPSLLLSVP